LLARSSRIGRVDLARDLESLGVDRRVSERSHSSLPIGRGSPALEGSAARADAWSVKRRLRAEDGFGLIELMMAMVLLNLGILAIGGGFNPGGVALRRASHVSTASALADSQMERYRALLYNQIGFDTSQISGLDNTYKCDSVLGASCPNTVTTCA